MKQGQKSKKFIVVPIFTTVCLGLAAIVLILTAQMVLASTPPRSLSHLEALVIPEPSLAIPTSVLPIESLSKGARTRGGWEKFLASQGGGWHGWFDKRFGLPMLASGRGIPWVPGQGNTLEGSAVVTLDALEKLAHTFIEENPELLGIWGDTLVLDKAASGSLGPGKWHVTFQQIAGGIFVESARLDFYVSEGNLVAFGATHLAPVVRRITPTITEEQARAVLQAYIGQGTFMNELNVPSLHLIPVDATALDGNGYAHLLVWQFIFRVPGEIPTWVAEIDADTGRMIAFFDKNEYERIKGGVYPLSNDGVGTSGTEQPNFPFPYADFSENGGPIQYSGDHGLYMGTTPGDAIVSALNGQYIRVADVCGAISESSTVGNDLDFGTSGGTDCTVPVGNSAGNTHAARSSFYHLNRAMEKGRAWLPSNAWLQSQVTDKVNINYSCNAFWDGAALNFFRAGACPSIPGIFPNGAMARNTGEIQGVFVHEWGHGLDQNDGGGKDNPGEAYADVVAIFEARESCIGRGFFAVGGNCLGYGDACLNCTGIRDQDWGQHNSHTPATPTGFVRTNCLVSSPMGPCGREEHCECHAAAEALFDLATRDLLTAGLDSATAWQLAERLFYRSRQGSGGNAYNCDLSVPSSDGCAATSWFNELRVADDDDGNLANGTPHAAAIFGAFNRHGIACGTATDASNQSTSSCPALAKPTVVADSQLNATNLTWSAVPGAASYNVLRNDLGCDRGQTIILTPIAPATSAVDDQLSNNFTVYYRVQPVGANPTCTGPVSECTAVTVGGADLSVSKSGSPDPVLTGHDLVWTIPVGNAGPGIALFPALNDPLATVTTFQSVLAPVGWSCSTPPVGSTGTMSCSKPSFGAGGLGTFSLMVNVNCAVSDGTRIDNSVSFISPTTFEPDTSNNTVTASVTASNPPPVIHELSARPDTLWPPNHRMVNVNIAYTVTDNCGTPVCALNVTSNEPENGLGDGDAAPDWVVLNDHSVMLRSERSGTGDGRAYAVGVTCTDSGGGASSAETLVKVPHDQSGQANGGLGFNATGTGFLPKAKEYQLFVLSTSDFNAATIVPSSVQVGGLSGVINANAVALKDINCDGRPDLVATFPVASTKALIVRSQLEPVAFRYQTQDGKGYIVLDIFKLGPPLQWNPCL